MATSIAAVPRFAPSVNHSFPALGHKAFSTEVSGVGARKRITLNRLCGVPGSRRKKKRVGRGRGSGRGKTSGRGHKGKKARPGNHGLRGKGFEGGQIPLYLRLPKFGFTNAKFRRKPANISLAEVQNLIDRGELNPEERITIKELYDAGNGAVLNSWRKIKHGVKLLGDGELKQPINIEVTKASRGAIRAVEATGGRLVTVSESELSMRGKLKPISLLEKGRAIPKRPQPKPKKMAYYVDYRNRGYLSPEVQLQMQMEKLGFAEPWSFQRALNETLVKKDD